jgi:hypothetical protein
MAWRGGLLVLELSLPRRQLLLQGAVAELTETAATHFGSVPKPEAEAAANGVPAVERDVSNSKAAEALPLPALHLVSLLLSLNVRR